VRVLIAEDDSVSRTILKKAVETFGHECLTAEDGDGAWKIFQSTPEVDVVISDWMMPGIDGPELCRRIRQVNRPEYTFFVFLTVLRDEEHLLEGMRAGADDYLAKPLDGEQLRARLIAASRVTSLHRQLRQEIAERKRAEAEFRRAEERYRTLVEQIPAVTYIQELADPGSNKTSPTVYTSPQIEAQSGYPPEAFVEDPELWVRLIHPDDRERVLAEERRTDETGELFEVEYRQIARDGRIVWIRDEAVLVRDEVGRPRFWQGVKLDITGRKRAEETLRESEEKYRRLVEFSPDAIIVHSEGRFVYVNAAGAVLFGASSPEELVGTPVLEVVHPDYIELVEARVRHIQEEGTPTEVAELKLVRLDGTVVDVETRGMPVTYGDRPATQVVIRDVTERKRAEKALREAEELFRSAFDNAPIGITLSSLDGRYMRVNPVLCDILGYSEEELLGLTFEDITHPEDYEVSMGYVDRMLKGEIDRYNLEKRYVRADGGPVWVSLSVSLVRDSDNRPLYYVAQVQDITERKRAEERLQEANRRLEGLAALRADFTAMVAHEIGSPLAAIRGYLDVLATGELEPAEQDDALARIRIESERLSTLVADMRSSAVIESGEFAIMPRETSARELFEDAARFAETLPGNHPLALEDDTAGGRVWADPYRIGQVLRNLLSNAAKYSLDGTPIRLRAMLSRSPGRVRFEVVDRGCGVHPDDVDRIFEKCGRGRDGSGQRPYGVGLGLYLSRRILQAHGGDLTLDSPPEGGSIFGFELETVGDTAREAGR